MIKDLAKIELEGLKVADVGSASKPVKQFIKMTNCEYKTFDIVNADYLIDLTIPITGLAYEDGYFDVVFCLSVFEHLKVNFEVAVKNLTYFLKKGGKLYFAIPAYLYPEHGVEYWRMTDKTIRNLFEKDFDIGEIKEYYPTAGLKLLQQAYEAEEIEIDKLTFMYFVEMIKK